MESLAARRLRGKLPLVLFFRTAFSLRMNRKNRGNEIHFARWLFLLGLLNAAVIQAKESFNDVRQTHLAAAAAFFSNGAPLHIDVQISDADVQALKKDNR